MVKVLFVCLGNICRSPMAEAVFRKMVEERGLGREIQVDSAGLGGWHAGERPHPGTRQVLSEHGIPHDWIRSRQIRPEDLQTYNYIVAMDDDNMAGLCKLGAKPGPRLFRLLDLVDEVQDKNVPDPYYTGNFAEVYDLVQLGCRQLLNKLTE